MKGLAVPRQKAEKVKQYLFQHGLLAKEYRVVNGKGKIIFPIKGEVSLFPFAKSVDIDFPVVPKRLSFKEELEMVVTPKERAHLISGFDVIGDIAIVEIPAELEKKEKKIAQLLLSSHPNIKTVVKKSGIHHGDYRTQGMVYLAGEKKKETVHRENGVVAKLHISKVYFSPRLAEERKRIASLVHPHEKVLVLFSGVGIYPLVIARKSNASLVYGIELNPIGHKYALVNKELNHLQNVEFICGDAEKAVKKITLRFDRIIMPLPKGAADFLESALAVAKKGTIIHFYDFCADNAFPKESKKKIIDLCKKHGVKCSILSVVKCGQYAPYVSRVCIDFQLK